MWLSGGAPVVDKKGKGALRVLDALTLDKDTLDRRARPSCVDEGTAQPSHCRPVILLAPARHPKAE